MPWHGAGRIPAPAQPPGHSKLQWPPRGLATWCIGGISNTFIHQRVVILKLSGLVLTCWPKSLVFWVWCLEAAATTVESSPKKVDSTHLVRNCPAFGEVCTSCGQCFRSMIPFGHVSPCSTVFPTEIITNCAQGNHWSTHGEALLKAQETRKMPTVHNCTTHYLNLEWLENLFDSGIIDTVGLNVLKYLDLVGNMDQLPNEWRLEIIPTHLIT